MNDESGPSPGRALRTARRAAGYLQKDLAVVLQISPQYLCDIEKGYRAVPEYLIEEMPDAIRKAVARALVAAHKIEISKLKRAKNG